MKLFQKLVCMALTATATASLSICAFAADYTFDTAADTDYYPSTSYEDTYGTVYHYGSKNLVDTDHKIPLQNTPGIERVRILGDHKQIQRNEHQRQHPEHIPGLRKVFILDHPPHAVRRRIIGDGGKQPADRMIANRRPQTEPWRSLRLRQTGQHSGVDRS